MNAPNRPRRRPRPVAAGSARALGAAALACLALGLAVSPRAAAAADHPTAPTAPPPHPPEVDLQHWAFEGEVARAPLAGGGTAELTLDRDLTRAAERLLRQALPRAGAVLLSDARTGRVLALAERGAGPLGVVTRSYPSASLFKLVTTAALIEAGVPADREVCTHGGKRRVDRDHLDAPRAGEQRCSRFGAALGHSRNAVFAALVTEHLERRDLADMAARMGFNRAVAGDLPALLGTFEAPYNDLEFARAATGFHRSALSPLGALSLAHLIAGGGRVQRLHLVARAGDWQAPAGPDWGERALSPEVAARLGRMMEVTVSAGTSRAAFHDPTTGRPWLGALRVAGKTGTLSPDGRSTVSWFTGFAPARNPRVAVTVLLENGPTWRRKANEVARDVFRVWFHRHGYRGVTDPFEPRPS